ncbi:MAG: hypothetical protein PHT13_00165 [Methanosarcina sp.]|nr:hypothetical protein [Methanosarcina sp.]
MTAEMREARIVVDLIHKQVNPSSFADPTNLDYTYSFLSFNNTQLDMDVSITVSITTGNNIFQITTWNLPTNRTLASGDQINIRVYWLQDTNKFKIYSGFIETIIVENDGQDMKHTLSGVLIEDFLMNTLKPRTVSESSYSNIVKTFGDLQSTLQIVGISTVRNIVPGWENLDHEVPGDYIQIGQKTVMEILHEIVTNFTAEVGKDITAVYNEQNSEVLFALNSDQESYGTITLLVLGDEDIFEYKMESVDTTDLEAEFEESSVDLETDFYEEDVDIEIVTPTVMVITTTGVVGFTRNEIFKYNEHYYIASDVIHTFTDSDGYLMDVYANIVG